mgnify:CR=1 FL=1
MRHLVERVLELTEAEQAAADAVAPPMDENSEVELQALLESLQPRIRVYGVGGAGCNAINRLFEERLFKNSYVTGYAINTDAQALLMSPLEDRCRRSCILVQGQSQHRPNLRHRRTLCQCQQH